MLGLAEFVSADFGRRRVCFIFLFGLAEFVFSLVWVSHSFAQCVLDLEELCYACVGSRVVPYVRCTSFSYNICN